MLRPWRRTATRTGEEPPGAARFLNFAPLPPTVQPAAGNVIDTDPPEGDRSESVAPAMDGSATVPVDSGVRLRATQRSFCFSPVRWILSFTPSIGWSTQALSCRHVPAPSQVPGVQRSP